MHLPEIIMTRKHSARFKVLTALLMKT